MHVLEIIINALYCGFNNVSWTPFSMIFCLEDIYVQQKYHWQNHCQQIHIWNLQIPKKKI